MGRNRPGGAPTRESESVTDLGLQNKEGQRDPQPEHSWGASLSPTRALLSLLLMTQSGRTQLGPQQGQCDLRPLIQLRGSKGLRKQEGTPEIEPPPVAPAPHPGRGFSLEAPPPVPIVTPGRLPPPTPPRCPTQSVRKCFLDPRGAGGQGGGEAGGRGGRGRGEGG